MSELRLERVCKSYGDVEVLSDIDLLVSHGEFCVVVGPSGCGKSTVLKVVSGLEGISSGSVIIDGQQANAIPAAERGLAMVFQSYALYPHMRVRQNLSFALENLKTPKSEIDRRVNEAAAMLRIDGLLDRKPTELSGGQRQRVAIGRAVVRDPKIFLFDEPLSNLDAELRVEMRGEIIRLHERLGNTSIYVTHDQTEAMTMADKIVVLRDGRVEQVGRPLDLFNSPRNRFVAGFLGSPSMNFIDVTLSFANEDGWSISKSGVEIHMKDIPAGFPGSQGVTAGVRANHLSLCDCNVGDFVLHIEGVEQLGSESYVTGRLESGDRLTVHSQGQIRVRSNESVGVRVDKGAMHFFDRKSGVSLTDIPT